MGVDEGEALGRVDVVLLGAGEALVSWMDVSAGAGARIVARRVSASGGRGPLGVLAGVEATRGSGFPRLARVGEEVVVAWTAPGNPSQVRAAVVSP
jgi:hypothetical protein